MSGNSPLDQDGGGPDPSKVMLTHMGRGVSGGFEIGLRDGEEGGVLHIIANYMAEMMQLDTDRPLNCMQMDVQPAGKPLLTLTMQRSTGKTPLALKAEAVALLGEALVAMDKGETDAVADKVRAWLAGDITAASREASA